MNTKTCTDCKLNLSLDNFSKNKQKKDGLNYRCKTCQKIYFKKHYENNKQYYIDKAAKQNEKFLKIIEQLKEDKLKNGCSVCGIYHPAILDFHHIDPSTKNFSIAKSRTKSKTKLINEINKCDVLCSNCHRILHWKEKTKYLTEE
jgi:hypothetical protein